MGSNSGKQAGGGCSDGKKKINRPLSSSSPSPSPSPLLSLCQRSPLKEYWLSARGTLRKNLSIVAMPIAAVSVPDNALTHVLRTWKAHGIKSVRRSSWGVIQETFLQL